MRRPARESRTGEGESANGVAAHMTDLDFLRGLIEAVDHSGIDSLEINRAGTRIRIAKTPNSPVTQAYASTFAAAPPVSLPLPAPLAAAPALAPAVPAPAAGTPASTPAATEPSAAAAAASAPAARATNLVDVVSPMVGTFYRAPAPDAPPYVEPGTHVSKGQTLCILEAMKLMNELESEVDGIVREVLVEDADPVEFGQVLFRIEPAGSK